MMSKDKSIFAVRSIVLDSIHQLRCIFLLSFGLYMIMFTDPTMQIVQEYLSWEMTIPTLHFKRTVSTLK